MSDTNPYQSPNYTNNSAPCPTANWMARGAVILLRSLLCLLVLAFVPTLLSAVNSRALQLEHTASGGIRFVEAPERPGEKVPALLLLASFVLLALSLFPLINDWRTRWTLVGAAFVSLVLACCLHSAPPGGLVGVLNLGQLHALGLLGMVAEYWTIARATDDAPAQESPPATNVFGETESCVIR